MALQRALAPVPADRLATALEFAQRARATERECTQHRRLPRPRRQRPAARACRAGPLLLGARVPRRRGRSLRLATATRSARRHGGRPRRTRRAAVRHRGRHRERVLRGRDHGRDPGQALGAARAPDHRPTSSNQYRHTTKPPEQIGRELGVQYLLTGTVHWEQGAGGARRVRVSPELIEVRGGRRAGDQVAAVVRHDVRRCLRRAGGRREPGGRQAGGGPDARQPSRSSPPGPTQNLAAYDAYLRSMALDGQSTRRHCGAHWRPPSRRSRSTRPSRRRGHGFRRVMT